MSAFTYGEAARMAFSGFGLVRRQPLTVLVWGVFSAMAMAAVVGLCAFLMFPAFTGFADAARDSNAAPNPARFMSLMLGFIGGYFTLLAGILLVNTVQGAAVFRSVLEPGSGGLAHLKLGRQELWLLAVAVSAFVLLSMAMTPFSMAMSVMMALSGSLTPQAPLGPDATADDVMARIFPMTATFWVMEGVVMLLSLFLMARYIMAFPMTFADKRFRLFESWTLTRGHTLKMALMLFLQAISQYIAIIAFIVILVLVGVATVMTRLPEGGLEAMAGKPFSDWIALTWPVIAAGGLISIPFFGVFAALYYAPLAEAYRRFRPPAADAFS